MRMVIIGFVTTTLICHPCFSSASAAQPIAEASPTLMREGKITEDELVKALTPSTVAPKTETDEELGGKTRGIRLANPQLSGTIAVSRPAKANLMITFITNSVELTVAAKQALDVVARGLASEKLATFKFNIEGHADRRGKIEDNLKLSMGRAESVKSYLVTNHKISSERLVPIGKGDREPLVVDQPAAPENRRVTFVTNQ
jgi:OmpA-OmpF porin, OOP family